MTAKKIYEVSNEEKRSLLISAFSRKFKPKKIVSGSEWADTNRRIASGTSPEPGRWNTSRVPYLKEPLDMATNKRVEQVVISAASQIGKSEFLITLAFYYMLQEPSTILFVQPTQDNAKAFVKERINPNISAMPELEALIKDDDKSVNKSSSNTVKEKMFAGGFLSIVGSRSPNDLASKPIRVLIADEVDRFAMTKEGDPLKLAIQRTSNFGNRKILCVSTPTVTHKSDGTKTIAEYYELSDKREYHLICPKCDASFVPKWEHVKWEKDSDNNVIEDTIKLVCPHCNATLRREGKIDPHLAERGFWKATAKSKIVGYHITALLSPWVELKTLVNEFVTSARTKNRDALKEFYNLRLGLPFEHFATTAQKWIELRKRCENYSVEAIPKNILFLTAGVDVQHNRIECSIYGWGEDYECWLIEHEIIKGDTTSSQTWLAFDEYLKSRKSLNTTRGDSRKLTFTFIDAGDGTRSDIVYKFTQQREKSRVFSIKGSSRKESPIIASKSKVGISHNTTLILLGVHNAKKNVYNMLEAKIPGPHFVHFPANCKNVGDEFFQQIVSESLILKSNDKTGVSEEVWHKDRTRNEALDCFVYAYCAAKSVQANFHELKQKLKIDEEATEQVVV